VNHSASKFAYTRCHSESLSPREAIGTTSLSVAVTLWSRSFWQSNTGWKLAPGFYPWLINTLKLQGNEAEACEWFVKWQGVQEADEEALQAFKTAYQRSGWRGVGLERIKRFDESKIRTYFREACMAAQADNKNKALEYLENSYRRREWGMAFIRFEPALDVLRGDPRFDDLVRRVGLN
jgi:tetratricopeptide (TPR) repeat protein